MKKYIIMLVAMGLVLSSCSCSYASEVGTSYVATYRITEEELDYLSKSLTRLSIIIETQQNRLTSLQEQLAKSREKSTQAEIQLAKLNESLLQEQKSLESANRLLIEYEQEEKAKIRKYKLQRNIGYTLLAGLVTYSIAK